MHFMGQPIHQALQLHRCLHQTVLSMTLRIMCLAGPPGVHTIHIAKLRGSQSLNPMPACMGMVAGADEARTVH